MTKGPVRLDVAVGYAVPTILGYRAWMASNAGENIYAAQIQALSDLQAQHAQQVDHAQRARILVGRRRRRVDDEHAPARWRIIGPVRNVDAWYKAFNVTPDNKYYLKPEARTRIW